MLNAYIIFAERLQFGELLAFGGKIAAQFLAVLLQACYLRLLDRKTTFAGLQILGCFRPTFQQIAEICLQLPRLRFEILALSLQAAKEKETN